MFISNLNLEASNLYSKSEYIFALDAGEICRAVEIYIIKRRDPREMSKSVKNVKLGLSTLWQGKFMLAFGAFGEFALHGGWTARTCEGPAICYVKDETALRASNHMLRLRTHLVNPIYLNQTSKEILKTFREPLRFVDVNRDVVNFKNN